MTDTFSHPDALLTRARFHIKELRLALKAYAESGDVNVLQDVVNDTYYLRLQFIRPLPDEIPCIIYDAISCLRTTLDYVVHAASAKILGVADVENTKFPVGNTPEFAASEFTRASGRGVPTELHEPLLKLQPWEGGNGHILWEFNKVRNKGTHRKLITLGRIETKAHGFNPGPLLVIHEQKRLQEWNDDHTILTILETKGFGDQEYGFRIVVAFDDALYFPQADVAETLTEISDVIEGIVRYLKSEVTHIIANRS